MKTKTIQTDLDNPQVTVDHGKVIKEKYFLNQTYQDFYGYFKDASKQVPPGPMIELGSGGGILKEMLPEVLTSDILFLPKIVDLCFSAEQLPFADNSVSALFLFNVLHHIKDPIPFFEEAQRCLQPGGKVVMVEPANTFFGNFIYRNFHHEPFEPKDGWEIKEGGPLSGANGALPWIIFIRDRKRFQKEYPQLKIEPISFHTPFRYLFSGGFSHPQLLPSFLYKPLRLFEAGLSPLNSCLALFMTISLTKLASHPKSTNLPL